jgi:hypothetical protein
VCVEAKEISHPFVECVNANVLCRKKTAARALLHRSHTFAKTATFKNNTTTSQVAHPTDCSQYLVCCAGEAVSYDCLKTLPGEVQVTQYGPKSRLSYHNALTGRCERADDAAASGGGDLSAVCGTNEPPRPISTAWAIQVCWRVALGAHCRPVAKQQQHRSTTHYSQQNKQTKGLRRQGRV